ncbi:beta-ketoacyl-ACP synthase II [Caballeronia humi]|uniref:3-oxoacyl-[acyl-carrier-protein] synthase 2 n=1 Tax=Caballeronia humi TaxID=326474 RepID=A0A158FZ39_9BURK|nr:beta-ketoacyl-ACP synthase II [Caballeronia humi]SAL25114.1 3-oxoacyl-(acyl carrier protein) synthase II [Caballeronia humi]
MLKRSEHPALRRVAVTGLGLVTPLGVGVEHVWSKLVAGNSGIGAIDRFDTSDLPCRIAGLVPRGRYADGGFDESEWLPARDSRKMDLFAKYAMTAAAQALDDAGWHPATDTDRERTGVLIGSGIGGLPGISEAAVALHEKGPRAISPFFIPSNLVNLAAGHVAIRHGLRGPTHAVATACASGAHALGDAARMIMLGDADVMIAGGAEAAVCRLGMAGFCAARALSTSFNDDPRAASRPWDAQRDGFVMGEGSGIVVLEDYEHALRRGARIHAELIGYGMSGDGHHIAAPRADGDGAARAMSMAIGRAGIEPSAIDYVNAHATSTQAGDEIELKAITRVFGGHATQGLSVSSTKGALGHLLGAAGSVEAIISILAMRAQIAPPTLNLYEAPQQFRDIDLVALSARPRPIRYALSNSFGFGGTNAALVFARPQ